MQSFLEQAAVALWSKYGQEISSLKLVFPSKRARLFFNDALSKLTDKPIWQPEYLSIDDLIWRISGLRQTDNLRLIVELHKVYGRYHDETFDKFYNWGSVLLQDFDTIDKYLVDADKLFANISDIKDIENQFGGESEEAEIVRKFWNNFYSNKKYSAEQHSFVETWRSLAGVYKGFRERLLELELAYAGMAYRHVAENINTLYSESDTYCFLGFNALNNCEQVLFSHLQKKGQALFLWDYSTYYIDDTKQEAGRFIRRNIKQFPQTIPLEINYNKAIEISVVSSPTDILQCKAVTRELETIFQRQGYVDKETAIVLTDEKLLQPILQSIPQCVERLNITMGYPITETLAYNLLERLLSLQVHKKNGTFYYKEVSGVLLHPYIFQKYEENVKEYLKKAETEHEFYVEHSSLTDFDGIFTPISTVEAMQKYLVQIFVRISDTDDPERREFTYAIISNISKLAEIIQNCDIRLELSTYISLLRQALSQIRIPYTGEPLGGLQIMGILETRNLDFDNVIMVSMNEDNFPGNRAGQSYIPFNLRQAYGLPTIADAEAMYAYYFYRLIQRAANLTMLYTSAADYKSTGEQSRYIYQLEYESDYSIKRYDVSLTIPSSDQAEIVIQKTDDVLKLLRTKKYSASALNRFIDCSLKFYFNDVARIKAPEAIEEEFSRLALGNVMHRALEKLYEPVAGVPNPQKKLSLVSREQIEKAVDSAFAEITPEHTGEEVAAIRINREVIIDYIRSYVRYDSAREEQYVVKSMEADLNAKISDFNFYGKLDRVDIMADGTFTIVDYKSGQGDKLEYTKISRLFERSRKKSDRNSAAFQAFLYCLMVAAKEKADVAPRLYVGRLMVQNEFSTCFSGLEGEVVKFDDAMKTEFQQCMTELMSEITDQSQPFLQTEIKDNCVYCDYKSLCNR